MRLSAQRIEHFQMILKELGIECSDEQAQKIGLTVMRFVIAKFQRQQLNKTGEK